MWIQKPDKKELLIEKLIAHDNEAPKEAIIPKILSGKDLTKDIREKMFGTVSGSNSMKPEKWQRAHIEKATGIECKTSKCRINLRTNKLEDIFHPNKLKNGFDYTENFDAIQTIKDAFIYINMKCVVGKGGAQTRSLREVYWFCKIACNFLQDN